MAPLANWVEDARLAARAMADYVAGLANPTVRLGVTGLSRAGKTVFLTALVQALMRGGSLPVFEAFASGRIARVTLEPQPDDAVPRFEFERHLAALTGPERSWPESTTRISELRLSILYQSAKSLGGSERSLTVDIVDYPGEWLLDLPLLTKSYAQWSRDTLDASATAARAPLAADWRAATHPGTHHEKDIPAQYRRPPSRPRGRCAQARTAQVRPA